MIRHLLGIVVTTALILLCTLLPFLPGGYDNLAVAFSEMAHMFGIVGLLLVPIGLLWWTANRSSRLAQRRHVFPLLALIASTLVWLSIWLAAIVQSGYVLSVVVVLVWIWVLRKVWTTFRQGLQPASTALPFYLIAAPIAVALLQWALVERAIDRSRNRAIANSAPLIAAIEEYRNRNGRYPTSLLAEWPDFKTGVMGVFVVLGQSDNGAFYDVQVRGTGKETLDIMTKQDVTVRRYFGPKTTDYKEIFKVTGNKIRFNDNTRQVTFSAGQVKKL